MSAGFTALCNAHAGIKRAIAKAEQNLLATDEKAESNREVNRMYLIAYTVAAAVVESIATQYAAELTAESEPRVVH